jgi:hypothetical protein
MATLTHHKKAVRALAMGKREFSFVSAAADNMKRWQVRTYYCCYLLLFSVYCVHTVVCVHVRSMLVPALDAAVSVVHSTELSNAHQFSSD